MTYEHQVAIVGGGPAGLQAPLTLGRMHVDTMLFDDARYRNASSVRLGNVLGWDGAERSALRRREHAELVAYPWVEVVPQRVESVRDDGTGLVLITSASHWRVGRLLIAAGVDDALLPIPGARELWGEVVLPCPYGHGHGFASGPITVISDGGHADHIGGLVRGLSASMSVATPGEVAEVIRTNAGVRPTLRRGGAIDAVCVVIPPNPVPRSTLADDLDIRSSPDGVEVDALDRTSRPGVWAAGDVAARADPRIPAAVITAMASGLTAAADITVSLAADR